MLEQTSTLVTIASCLAAVLGAVFSWLRWIRPPVRRWIHRTGAALDTLAGREAIVDNITGKVYSEALPSIGVRMASVEGSVARLVEVIESQHQQDKRLDDHDHRIGQLENGAIERIATKAESAQAWRAMAAVAHESDPMTQDATPDDDAPELD